MFATIGALAALEGRRRTGRGQVVDSAIYESVLGVMESLVPEWQVAGYQGERTGAALPGVAPSNVHPTGDGEWVLVAANRDTFFARLADAMGQPQLATDPRHADHESRGEHQEALDELIAACVPAPEPHARARPLARAGTGRAHRRGPGGAGLTGDAVADLRVRGVV